MRFILLILGLVVIIKSADVMVDSASKIARRYGVSTFVIGITVVAFGTSAPELAVGIMSGLAHANQLTLGNIVGSSMSNMALIVGLSAVIFPLQVKDSVVRRELPILFAVQAALCAMIFIDGRLSRPEGFILLAAFAASMIYIARGAKASMRIKLDAEGDIDTDGDGNSLPAAPAPEGKKGLLRLWCYAVLSLAGLFLGGKLTVDSSVQIAQSFGLSETLIGLTVVAIATTMPELMTSIMAARKKEPDIVLGNCIGSNIFNILLVLGLSASISPITVTDRLLFDMLSTGLLTLFVFIVSLRHKKIRRLAGIILLSLYFVYLAAKVFGALLLTWKA